jgi:hypothetical protein
VKLVVAPDVWDRLKDLPGPDQSSALAPLSGIEITVSRLLQPGQVLKIEGNLFAGFTDAMQNMTRTMEGFTDALTQALPAITRVSQALDPLEPTPYDRITTVDRVTGDAYDEAGEFLLTLFLEDPSAVRWVEDQPDIEWA